MRRSKEPDYGRRLALAMATNRVNHGQLSKLWAAHLGTKEYSAAAILSLYLHSTLAMTLSTYRQLLKLIRRFVQERRDALRISESN